MKTAINIARKLEAVHNQLSAQLNADEQNFEGSVFLKHRFWEIQKFLENIFKKMSIKIGDVPQ